ncbi:MAG: hypothetical protein M1818_003312 [Claussenomyces sp. TS43310]|nr:MAG: hypothetical protein M1818_003312 [Claussenomyces sp. TS43310]
MTRATSARRYVYSASRLYSHIAAEPRLETVQIRSGSGGSIDVHVQNPSPSTPNSLLILHILSSLNHKQREPAAAISASSSPVTKIQELNLEQPPFYTTPKALSFSDSTVVSIAPRWSKTDPFPTPLHDVLVAFDWVVANLCSSSTFHTPRPIAVCGSSIGGTLATSLALTESRPGKKSRISALAVQDAVFNWTDIATSIPSESDGPTMKTLLDARGHLFSSPAGCFDAFASPILFFRTSGLHVPLSFPSTPSSEEVEPAGGQDVDGPELNPPLRRSNLKFPAKGSGLRLPYTRIAVTADLPTRPARQRGKGSSALVADALDQPLVAQAEEMARLMRRSVALHELNERVRDDPDGRSEGQVVAARRIELISSQRQQQHDEGQWAADFFRDVLG